MLLALQLNNLLGEAVDDTTPDQFSFTAQTSVARSGTITSAAVTITGIDAASAITVSGGTYDINASGTFTADPGTVESGDTVRARHTSSASYSTATNTVVTIGGVSGTFTSTTLASNGALPIVFTSFTNLTNEGAEVYAATSAGTSNTAQGQIALASLADRQAWIECQKPATGDAATVLAFDALRTQQSYGFNDFIAFVSTAGLVQQGVNTTVLTTVYTLPEGAGSRMRLHRSALNVVTIQTTEDDGAIWTVRHTFAATPTVTLRAHIYTTYSTTPRRIYQVRQYGLILDILGARFAADGNSQTVGINGASLSFPGLIATALGVTVTNYGVGGQSTVDMIADAAAQIDAAFTSAPNILIVGEVRNHLVALDAGATARVAVDSFWEYCDGRRAAAAAAGRSLHIVAWNVLPAGHTASSIGITALNALFVEANALMAAEWEDHVDAFVDVRSDVRLTDCFDLTYFDDDVHLTAAGDEVMRDLLIPAIQGLASLYSFIQVGYAGGTAVDADGIMGTDFLNDATAVPSTKIMLGGIAHDEDGLRYVALWPASDEVYYSGGRALREDGAMIIATSGTAAGYYGGIAMTFRGETLVSTDEPEVVHNGFGLRETGALCVSESS